MRKVSAREFFIHNFRRDPSHRVEKKYFKEWQGRFGSGHPERYMDEQSLRMYRSLQGSKRSPASFYPTGWKGKGGQTLRIVRVK